MNHYAKESPGFQPWGERQGVPKTVALYVRSSVMDHGQTAETQLLDLRRYAQESGWTIQSEHHDDGLPGARNKRPGLDKLMNVCRQKQADIVLVHRLSHFAYSLKHLVSVLDELRGLKVEFVSVRENMDTNSPLGQVMFSVIAAMAELEKDIATERIYAGLRRARSEGRRLGRPPVVVNPEQVVELRRQGLSIREISKQLATSKTKICSTLKAQAAKRRD